LKQIVGDVIILPQLLLVPSSTDDRILLQPSSAATFKVQISDIPFQTAISFTLHSSDQSVASASARTFGMRAADFSIDVNWIGAGSCVVTVSAVCNCSANSSSALLYVHSLPLLLAVPSAVDVVNPQSDSTINISLQHAITSSVVINLQPSVPLGFFITPATITIAPAVMFASVTISYGRPGRYTIIASSPFPGSLSGLLLPIAAVVVRPLLLAEQFNVVIPQSGTLTIKFLPLPLPIDAPIIINIFPFSSGGAVPKFTLNTTTFALFPTSSDDVMSVMSSSIVDFWSSGSVAAIRFSITAPASSIYSGAQGVAAVLLLLPRIEFSSNVYVPLLGRSTITITAIRTELHLDALRVEIDGGGSEILMLMAVLCTFLSAAHPTLHLHAFCMSSCQAARLTALLSGQSTSSACVVAS
jgi:hypothetical protein